MKPDKMKKKKEKDCSWCVSEVKLRAIVAATATDRSPSEDDRPRWSVDPVLLFFFFPLCVCVCVCQWPSHSLVVAYSIDHFGQQQQQEQHLR